MTVELPGVIERPPKCGRMGDVVSGGGYGFVIRQQSGEESLWVRGTTFVRGQGSTVVWTAKFNSASWWKSANDARQWADANVMKRSVPYDVARIAFPVSSPAKGK